MSLMFLCVHVSSDVLSIDDMPSSAELHVCIERHAIEEWVTVEVWTFSSVNWRCSWVCFLAQTSCSLPTHPSWLTCGRRWNLQTWRRALTTASDSLSICRSSRCRTLLLWISNHICLIMFLLMLAVGGGIIIARSCQGQTCMLGQFPLPNPNG